MSENKLTFDAQPSMRTVDENGYMHVALTNISKACVNPYLGSEIPGWDEEGLDPDRIYYGLRDPDELEKAVDTFNGLPLLMNHHEIDAEVQPKEFIVGSTGTDAVFEAPYLKNSLSITDAEAIEAVKDGTMKEISCAYFFQPEFTSGEYEDGAEKVHYDFIMRDIKGNHVALVAEGRAGHDVKVADNMPDKIKEGSAEKVKKALFKKLAKDGKMRKATIDEILEVADIDEEKKEEYKDMLNTLAEAIPEQDDEGVVLVAPVDPSVVKSDDNDEAQDDVQCDDDDEVTDEDDVQTDDDEEVTDGDDVQCDDDPSQDDDFEEKMKDPMFRAGFEAGTKYGEKREKADPQRIDSDHEREGMEKKLGEDSVEKLRKQFAKATEKARKQAVQDAKRHYRALNAAAEKVVPLVGRIHDPLAFDSASDIYAFALKQCGKNPERYNKAAYKGMVDMLLENKTAKYGTAQDSAFYGGDTFDKKTNAAFSRLKNIR